jgi:hypothetical protein
MPATQVYTGTVTAVAQVTTVQVTAYDAATTYTITAGISPNTHAVSVVGNTDVDTTASDLRVACAASSHPYFTNITFTVATDTVTCTASTAGAPFTIASSVTGGAGTIGAASTTTANDGPNVFNSAGNWASGVAPVNTDTVYKQPGSPPWCWNIDTSLTGITLNLPDGIGNIGLNSAAFATSADGATVDTSKPEYREPYFKADWTTCSIGLSDGPSSVTSPTRLMLWNEKAGSSTTNVYSVSGVSADAGKPTLRLHTINSGADINVVSAIGGWGLAVDTKDEVSTAGDIQVTADSSATKTYLGEGSTWTSFIQRNGTSQIFNANAGATTTKVRGGTCEMLGAWTTGPTIVVNKGGTLLWSATGAGISTLTISGTFDSRKALAAPVINAFVPTPGATLLAGDLGMVYSTGITEPDGLYTLTFS